MIRASTRGDLVGAIANESKISGKNIGHIRLFDTCSSIYLPEGIDEATLESLKNVKVRNKALDLKVWTEDGFRGDRRSDRGGYERRGRGRGRDSDQGFRRDRERRSGGPRRSRREES